MTIRSFHARSAVGALLVCVAACSRGGSSNPANPANPADSANGAVANADPPTRAARLSSVDGDVSLQTPGSDSWSAPTPNYTVSTGDRLATRGSGRAELDLGNAAMRLDDSADVTVTNLTDHFTQLGVDQGDFDASLYQYDPSDSVEIDTPNGALMPTAAGTYLVSVDPNGNATTVRVESGSLDLTGPDLNQSLTAGQVVRLVGTNPIQVVAVTSPSPSIELRRPRSVEHRARSALAGERDDDALCESHRAGVGGSRFGRELDGRSGEHRSLVSVACGVDVRAISGGSLVVGRAVGMDVGRRRAVGIRDDALRALGADHDILMRTCE